MKNKLISIIITFTMFNFIFGQDSIHTCIFEIDTLTNTHLYLKVDTEPSYPGGRVEMMKFIQKNLAYLANDCYSGRIFVSFIVEVSGKISTLKIVKSINKEIDQTAIDVINKMPDWIPATCQNKNVRSTVILPFYIALD